MIDTGYPHADAQSDFQRQRRRQVLSQLAARLRREPDDVSDVLPFDEVVDRARLPRRAPARAAGDPPGRHRRQRQQGRRLRPVVPPQVTGLAGALGAAGPRAARGRGPAADRGLPDRRAVLRAGRPPPRLRRHRAAVADDRRQRHRGADEGGRHRHLAPRRPHRQRPAPGVPRPRAAARPGAVHDPGDLAVVVRGAERDGRGVGLPADAAGGPLPRPRHGGPALVRRGVPARGADAARGRPRGRAAPTPRPTSTSPTSATG